MFLPLFPQTADATTGSVRDALRRLLAPGEGARWAPHFYADPGFLEAFRAAAGNALEDFAPDHVLASYHGLPEQQVRQADPMSP